MTAVNLLPVGIRTKQRTRQLTILVAAGAAAAVTLLVVVFALQSGKLARADQAINAQKGVNQGLAAHIGRLQKFEHLRQRVTEREALATGLVHGQILWSTILQNLASITPPGISLTTMSATLTAAPVAPVAPVQPTSDSSPSPTSSAAPPPATVAPAAPTTGIAASIQFQGTATDQPTVALWLTRLEALPGWVDSWVTADSKVGDGTTGFTVNFSGSVDLTTDVTTDGGSR